MPDRKQGARSAAGLRSKGTEAVLNDRSGIGPEGSLNSMFEKGKHMSYKFRGGVHPKPNKELSADKPFETLLPKGEMVYPISQHIGKPARPVVKRNDEVLAGQLIAEADGFVSANIYATVSGKVKAIEHRRTSAGVPADCIVVTNDGQYNTVEGIGEECDPDTLTNSEIIDRIKMAGIVGLGGAGFPTHVKLSPRNPEEIRWIIANGAECEPGITCDDRLMRERPEWVIEGMRCVLRLFDKAKGIIAIEENKPEAIEAIEEALEGDDRISVMTLQVRYPQGSERNLVHAATGMYMESGALPASLGCIVDNVWTLAAIYRAVCFNEPLMEKGFTVTGEGAVNPGNFLIRIGTSVSEVLEAAGGTTEDTKKILLGGPMMGMAIPGTDVPLVKANNALYCMTEDEVEIAEGQQTNCIRCGRCIRSCPLGLSPQLMLQAAERNDLDRFIALHGLDCIQCGCCTYTCPARRPLVPVFKLFKPRAMAYNRAKQQKEGNK